MEIVPYAANATKSNRWWPDGPFDDRDYSQADLFMTETGQMVLL